MADDLDRIQTLVTNLVRREKALLLLDVVGRSGLLFAGFLVIIFLAPSVVSTRSLAMVVLTLVVGLGGWFVLANPIFTRWSRCGDLLRQAHLVEACAPQLRGRLVTVVRRLDGPESGESPELLGLVARRALTFSSGVHPADIHGATRHVTVVVCALIAMGLPLPLSFVSGGPIQAVSWWTQGAQAAAAVALQGADAQVAQAKVGDLTVRYVYPAYTGLEPHTVENSTGNVQGPPGTEVTVVARSAQSVDAAGLVAYEKRFEAKILDREEGDARMVEGSFAIDQQPGTYHLVTWFGEKSLDSKDFLIKPIEDLPPEIRLDTIDSTLELAVDEDFQLLWKARDDYGITRVELQLDGRTHGSPIYRMKDRKAEVFGDLWRSPEELGLSPGDEVKLELAAYDNNTVAGEGEGRSQVITLVVLGARGLDQRSDVRQRQLIDAMLGVLADHLEQPFPPSVRVGDLATYSEQVAKQYQPLQQLVDAEWDRLPTNSIERRVVGNAIDAGGELVRFAAVTFERRSNERALDADLVDLQALRDAAILALEDGILALDRGLRMAALADVVQIAENMDGIGKELKELMSQDDPDNLAMLAMLEQLESMMNKLGEASAKLDEGGLKEFVNARKDELRGLIDEIRKAIAEGRTDDAKKLMERLANQLQQLSEGVHDTLERQQSDGDDTMEKASQLTDELEKLEQEQRELQKRSEDLQEQTDAEASKEMEKLWKEIQEEAGAVAAEVQSYKSDLRLAKRDFNEVQRAENGVIEARHLQSKAAMEDLRGTKKSVTHLEYNIDSMARSFKTSRMFDPSLKGPGDAELASLLHHIAKLKELLEQLEEQASGGSSSPETQALQQQQQALEERLESAQQAAEELAKDMPVRPGKMKEQLKEAGERMREAGEDLGDGKPMPARGSQGAAADRIKEARESMENAMDQARQQQQQQQGRSQGKSRPRDAKQRDEGGTDHRPQDVQIPGGEEFRTPEEYRRALLEGMEGDVPEEYRAMKKRYFEELVRQ